jgi:hypothetical protein
MRIETLKNGLQFLIEDQPVIAPQQPAIEVKNINDYTYILIENK